MHDSSPERRNLIITSIFFILFKFGGGTVDYGSDVKLMFVNVRFENTQILIIFLWALICWFFIRFIQKHNNEFSDELTRELVSSGNKTIRSNNVERFIKKATGLNKNEIGGFCVHSFGHTDDKGYFLNYNIPEELGTDRHGNIIAKSSRKMKEIKMDELNVFFMFFVHSVLNGNYFNNYIIPIILFYFSVFIYTNIYIVLLVIIIVMICAVVMYDISFQNLK